MTNQPDLQPRLAGRWLRAKHGATKSPSQHGVPAGAKSGTEFASAAPGEAVLVTTVIACPACHSSDGRHTLLNARWGSASTKKPQPASASRGQGSIGYHPPIQAECSAGVNQQRRAPARLILVLAQHFAGFQIDEMHAGAGDALERLIGIIIVSHLIGGPSLHVLAGVGATIEKRPQHR